MPHLRFRSVSHEVVQKASAQLPKLLSEIMSTDVENFSFEKIETQFFKDGNVVDSYPFVEVLWFSRNQEVKNQSAKCITDMINKEIGPVDIVVVFIDLNRESYYENGQHF